MISPQGEEGKKGHSGPNLNFFNKYFGNKNADICSVLDSTLDTVTLELFSNDISNGQKHIKENMHVLLKIILLWFQRDLNRFKQMLPY